MQKNDVNEDMCFVLGELIPGPKFATNITDQFDSTTFVHTAECEFEQLAG